MKIRAFAALMACSLASVACNDVPVRNLTSSYQLQIQELRDRGVTIAREARQEPWGLFEMHVNDPDGITLIFVQVPEYHPLRGAMPRP